MRRFFVVSLAALFFLTGCNNTKKPSNANFTKAINQYLAKRNDACSSLGQTLPVNVTVPEQKDQYGIGPQLAALEEVAWCIPPIRQQWSMECWTLYRVQDRLSL